MSLNVCILVMEKALHWAPFYIEAFREVCDRVITIGQACDTSCFETLGWKEAPRHVLRNDIVTDTNDAIEALSLLPDDFTPHLVVAIQSGGVHYRNIPRLSCPTAYISVDTWHAHEEFVRARDYDFVFVAQKVFLPYFRETGSRHARWLPLAASRTRHTPVDAVPQMDFVFVGTTEYQSSKKRCERLKRLSERYGIAVERDCDAEGMSWCYGHGRLGFNSSIAQDVNMRVFEVMAMGCPLFTNRDAAINGLTDLFEEGRHFIGYSDEDMLEQAERYLADEPARRRIADAGRAAILEGHTYVHRVRTLLDTVASHSSGWPDAYGTSASNTVRQGEKFSAYLPHGAKTLLDIGLGMDRSCIALRRMGYDRVDGLARDAESAAQRSRAYDAIRLLATSGGEAWEDKATYDVACIHTAAFEEAALERLIRIAGGALCGGGTLLWRLSELDLARFNQYTQHAAMDEWLDRYGFHFLAVHPMDAGAFIQARKYARPVAEVSREIFDRFPMNQ